MSHNRLVMFKIKDFFIAISHRAAERNYKQKELTDSKWHQYVSSTSVLHALQWYLSE